MNYIAVSKWEQMTIFLEAGDTFIDPRDNKVRAFRAVEDGSCSKCCFHTCDVPCSLDLNICCSGSTHFIEINPAEIMEDLI